MKPAEHYLNSLEVKLKSYSFCVVILRILTFLFIDALMSGVSNDAITQPLKMIHIFKEPPPHHHPNLCR
jgi:hypothetical protein